MMSVGTAVLDCSTGEFVFVVHSIVVHGSHLHPTFCVGGLTPCLAKGLRDRYLDGCCLHLQSGVWGGRSWCVVMAMLFFISSECYMTLCT
jgi:hypothetical protein